MLFQLMTENEDTRGARVRAPSSGHPELIRLRVGVLDVHASHIDVTVSEARAISRALQAAADLMDR